MRPVTLRHDLHALSLFCQYARKQGWLVGDPMEDVEIPSDLDAKRFHEITAAMETLYFAKCLKLGRSRLARFRAAHDPARSAAKRSAGCAGGGRGPGAGTVEDSALEIGRGRARADADAGV